MEEKNNQFYNNKSKYIIEEYNYSYYPSLKELYENYYYNNSSNEIVKFDLDYENIGIIYFILARKVMPVFALISSIILIISKCKNKYKRGFVAFEIFSIELKLILIFWSFILLKLKYNKNIDNSNEEIQYII